MRLVAILMAAIVMTASAEASPAKLEHAIEGLWGLDREASINTRSIADCDTSPTRFRVNSEGDRAVSLSLFTSGVPITSDIEIDSLRLLADGDIEMDGRMPFGALITVDPAKRIVFEMRDAQGNTVPGHTVVLKRCPETAFF